MCETQTNFPKVHPLIQPVLQQFNTIFDTKPNFPPSRDVDHTIPLVPNSKLVNLRPYRYSHFQKCELEKIIEELLSNSVIRPSSSPFASPALLVKKKRWKLETLCGLPPVECFDHKE
jgi:hypothetical protein